MDIASDTITVEKMMEAIKKIPIDPVVEYMRKKGFDPDKGGRLIWPVSRQGFWEEDCRPNYVMVCDVNDIFMITSTSFSGLLYDRVSNLHPSFDLPTC